jgi:hypothetical protein
LVSGRRLASQSTSRDYFEEEMGSVSAVVGGKGSRLSPLRGGLSPFEEEEEQEEEEEEPYLAKQQQQQLNRNGKDLFEVDSCRQSSDYDDEGCFVERQSEATATVATGSCSLSVSEESCRKRASSDSLSLIDQIVFPLSMVSAIGPEVTPCAPGRRYVSFSLDPPTYWPTDE